MKKLFIVLAVASLGFVACNNDADKTTTDDSTTVKSGDTTVTVHTDDTTHAPVDTLKVDTTVKK
ncbi:MAG: hypothetical protein H7Y42_14185 [Chitinophagaceae bacterium]|nr:hypothetical protein [Chitinophagaceae bacterium]